MLVIMSGQPASGKTAISRAVALATGAVHLRIDTIEQAIVRSGLAAQPLEEAGYIVAYALAEDHLKLGLDVIADSVNPLRITRDAWRDVAERVGAPALEVEVLCSDLKEHRRRALSRTSDIEGLGLPNWQAILDREYHSWNREHLVVESSRFSIEECTAQVVAAMAAVRTEFAGGPTGG